MNEATIVSLFPMPINEHKPGITPGHFHIEPAKDGDFEILVVGSSFYWVSFVEDERRPLKVDIPALEVATAIVNDFCDNIPNANRANGISPGLGLLPGRLTKLEIQANHTAFLAKLREQQMYWYHALVIEADDVWNRSRQHRLITSLQRLACKGLGQEREWIIDMDSVKGPAYCPACRSRVHPEAVLCPNCKFILNEDRFKKLKFADTPKD